MYYLPQIKWLTRNLLLCYLVIDWIRLDYSIQPKCLSICLSVLKIQNRPRHVYTYSTACTSHFHTAVLMCGYHTLLSHAPLANIKKAGHKTFREQNTKKFLRTLGKFTPTKLFAPKQFPTTLKNIYSYEAICAPKKL